MKAQPTKLTPTEIAARRKRHGKAIAKWIGMPPGLPPELAEAFETQLKNGKTVKDLTSGARTKYSLVSYLRFKKHCELNPIWAVRIQKLNAANISRKKSCNHARTVATKKVCLKGLHPMRGHNVIYDRYGRRKCRACNKARGHGKPMTPEVIGRLKTALEQGASMREVLFGYPTGGGLIDRSLVITTHAKFAHQCEIDQEFAEFVKKHTAASAEIGRTLSKAKGAPAEFKPTLITVARLKHKIRTMQQSQDGRGAA